MPINGITVLKCFQVLFCISDKFPCENPLRRIEFISRILFIEHSAYDIRGWDLVRFRWKLGRNTWKAADGRRKTMMPDGIKIINDKWKQMKMMHRWWHKRIRKLIKPKDRNDFSKFSKNIPRQFWEVFIAISSGGAGMPVEDRWGSQCHHLCGSMKYQKPVTSINFAQFFPIHQQKKAPCIRCNFDESAPRNVRLEVSMAAQHNC